MRRGTKKCILLLLAILLLCLLAWRLTPHTFEEMTASDRDEITSLAGVVSLSGVRDGRAYTESYALQNVTPEDTAFEGVLMLLNSTRYREDFRNLLPWPIESVSAGRAYDGRGVSLMLVWGPSEDECCSLSLSGRQIVVSRPHHDGFLIYHPEDPKLLNWLAIYLANNGEKGGTYIRRLPLSGHDSGSLFEGAIGKTRARSVRPCRSRSGRRSGLPGAHSAFF